MIKSITSKENKIIKLVTSLQKRSYRNSHGLFVVEGKRICDEAFLWFKQYISFVLISESYYTKNPELSMVCDTYKLPDSLFSFVCGTETPQGIMAVVQIPANSDKLKSDNILILDGISEPGNMGTILRTAEAMGFCDIFITKGSVDVYSPKVVRSTMGSIFRLNFHFEENTDFISNLKNSGYQIIATALKNSVSLETVVPLEKNAIVIGNEAKGVSDAILNNSDIITKIDMCGNSESLNAAVAAGIVMYRLSKKEL